MKPILFAVLSSGALLVSAALSQDAIYQGLTARELCLRPPAAPTSPARKGPPKPKAATSPVPTAPSVAEPAGTASREREPEITLISNETPSVPLGMLYSLRKRIDGKYEEVSPDSVFHAGDRIQLHVETFDHGYLYIIQQGSSKRWEVLFPNPDTASGDNRVAKNQVSKLQFYFDQQAGTERLFVVFTRKPVGELENLIYSLAGKAESVPVSRPKVLDPAPVPKPQKVMMAQNRPSLDDQLVAGLRTNFISRDLVFEKVDEDTGDKSDKAVYVAVPTRSPDARLVADINLKHE